MWGSASDRMRAMSWGETVMAWSRPGLWSSFYRARRGWGRALSAGVGWAKAREPALPWSRAYRAFAHVLHFACTFFYAWARRSLHLLGENWISSRAFAHPTAGRRFEDVSSPGRGADIGRGRADHPAAALLLERVGDPGRRPRDGEDRREGLARQAAGVEDERRIHLAIGLQPPTRLEPLQRRQRPALDLLREGQAFAVRIEPPQGPAQHVGTGVADAEDAVAEAHQPAAAGERAVEPAVDVAARGDLIEHVKCQARRTAVQRAGERAIGADHCRRERGARRDDDARGKCGGPQAVVDDGREIGIERRDQARLDGGAVDHA